MLSQKSLLDTRPKSRRLCTSSQKPWHRLSVSRGVGPHLGGGALLCWASGCQKWWASSCVYIGKGLNPTIACKKWMQNSSLLQGIDQKVELSTGVSGAPGVSSLSAALKEQLIDGHRSCQACGQPRKVHNVKPLTSSGEIPLPCSQDANAGLRPSLLHQFSLWCSSV